MSYKTNPEENAFPLYVDCNQDWENGLSKREYIAAMALQGYISATQLGGYRGEHKDAAEEAVAYADALITALNDEEAAQ